MNKTLRTLLAGVLAVLTLGLAGCGAGAGADTDKPLVILADATPHSEILQQAEKLGLLGDTKIEIKTIVGDIDANQLVQSGDVDANYFQHKPYLETWKSQKGVDDLVGVANVHIEPLGLYSKKVKDLKAVPSGATIAIPADPSNLVRALFLLQQADLLTLDVKPTDANVDYSQITTKNITANPNKLKFIQIDRPQLAATLDDAKVDLSIINGNYALEAGLKPKTDSLALESADENPYTNLLVVKSDKKDDPRVQKLAEALQSKEIQDWINSNFEGSVLPAGK
ncbi:MetQ/NlpA family ABC transporter substrate-binding protein [Luteococcus sp. Sow4_B9]|uniref:MetQ/NlpA family ABC transporter substrate-binding protein n=1 Tax=Luteococcus sp. Sow4_B9 TaxID=3438792 RepID=UPI003F9EA122